MIPGISLKSLALLYRDGRVGALAGAALLLFGTIMVGCGRSNSLSSQPTRTQTNTANPTITLSPLSPSPKADIAPTSVIPSPSPVGGSENRLPSASKRVSAEFLQRTKVGQAVLAYLRCIDFDCTEKLKAVVALGPDAVPPLIQLLRNGVAPEVEAELPGDAPTLIRLRASHALGELRDDRALEPLDTLLQDVNPLVRAEVAAALGKIGGEKALNSLLPLLRDSDQLVREMTAQALAELGRSEALPALRSAVQAEPQAHVRRAMEAAIRTLEGR